MQNVVIIGSLNIDVLQKLDRLPTVGETISINSKSTNFGGKGANQAVAAARQGATVSFIGGVGEDPEGRSYIDLLNEEGIHTDAIYTKSVPTGTAYIMLEKNGHNTILVYGGANMALSRADIDQAQDLIKHADVVVAQLEVPQDAIKRGFELAHQYGAKTILNPAPVTDYVDPDILKNTDLLVPNETEAAALLGLEPTTDYKELVARTSLFKDKLAIENVIITLGEHGAFYAIHGKPGLIKSFKADAIDTTAAGDTFIGTIAATLAADLSNIEETLKKASIASSIVVSRPGAIPAIPYQDEIVAKLSSNN